MKIPESSSWNDPAPPILSQIRLLDSVLARAI